METKLQLSNLKSMDDTFAKYCKENSIAIDLTQVEPYNAYKDELTGESFCWFVRGMLYAQTHKEKK